LKIEQFTEQSVQIVDYNLLVYSIVVLNF